MVLAMKARKMWLRGITMPRSSWDHMTTELQVRTQGRRESGAFLLAHTSNPRRIVDVAYYDDLDPASLNGEVHFHGDGFISLWELCAKRGLTVIGDIHTHPGSNVQQSSIDQANPMIDRKGHIALILPNCAAGAPKIKAAGIYKHLGKCHWRRLPWWRRWHHIRISLR